VRAPRHVHRAGPAIAGTGFVGLVLIDRSVVHLIVVMYEIPHIVEAGLFTTVPCFGGSPTS